MTGTKTFYDTLGVSPTADPDDIQRIYRRLSKLYHPDVNPDPAAAEKLKDINEAYDTVGDERKRRAYDAELRLAGSYRADPPGTGTASGFDDSARSGNVDDADVPDSARGAAHGTPEGQDNAGFVPDDAAAEPEPVVAPARRRVLPRGSNPLLVVPALFSLLFAVGGCAWLEAPLFSSVRAPQGVELSALSVLVMLVIAVALYIPWNARALWKPFPVWEQVLLYLATAVLLPFGWRGFGTLILLLAVYLPLVAHRDRITRRLRRTRGDVTPTARP